MFKRSNGMMYIPMQSVMPWHLTGLHCHTHYHS